ncbi:CD59 glycoprotein MAC-inhibitory protein [Collichthys lucidus]|uniref:CD59 glycoprotein MAC-inhibitory protein n=1 Tax=Collichthys lucidus TaxID=240159 RepID=A0A4U5VJE8_COLLU|nr:CD59 glycoprotein MAC-inhibitory protein [Collichthys lucidus]
MRTSGVFFLAVSFIMFGFGLSLKCYSCPDGSISACDVEQDCNQDEDGCLKLTSANKIYTRCIRYADCDFMTLANKYVLPNFDFNCCQSKLCNGQKKSLFQKLFG